GDGLDPPAASRARVDGRGRRPRLRRVRGGLPPRPGRDVADRLAHLAHLAGGRALRRDAGRALHLSRRRRKIYAGASTTARRRSRTAPLPIPTPTSTITSP